MFESRVLTLRAGLRSRRVHSQGFVAKELGVPRIAVRRSEQRGLSKLRRARRSGGCEASSPSHGAADDRGLPSILRGLGLTAADGRGAAGVTADRSGTRSAHASGGSETPVEAAASPGAVAGAAATDDSVPQALVWSLLVFLLLCLMPLVAVARRKRKIAATPSPAPREARASATVVTPDNRGDAAPADEAPYLPPPWADGSARR